MMISEDMLDCLCFYPTMWSANCRPDASNAESCIDTAPTTPLESDLVVTVENGVEKDIMEVRLQHPDIPATEPLVSLGNVYPKQSSPPSRFGLHHDLFPPSSQPSSAVRNIVKGRSQLPPSPPAISEPELTETNSTWLLDLQQDHKSAGGTDREASVLAPPEILSMPEAALVNVETDTSKRPLQKEEAFISISTPSVIYSTYETTAYQPSGGTESTSLSKAGEDHTAKEMTVAPDALLPKPKWGPFEDSALLTLTEEQLASQTPAIEQPDLLPELSQEEPEEPALLFSTDNNRAQENITLPGGSLLESEPKSSDEPALWTTAECHKAEASTLPSVNLPPPSQPEPPEEPEVELTGDASSTVSANDDTRSIFNDEYYSDTSSYTASLLSDVKDYAYENGRRYHSYREGHYVLPNDDQEQDRQDLLHHVRNLVLNGALFRAPLSENLQRVLDIGTGTGIWAIDFADSFPSAEVTGTDLSPIQPSWVPTNLRFLVDDAESPWLFSASRPFDFIHARDLGGAIADWPRLLQQAYDHLQPGGWIELQEFEVTLKSDDDSLRLAPTLCEFLGRLHQASEAFNRPMNIAEGHRQRLIEAGFKDVRDEVYKVPSSGWSENPLQKQIGRYNLCSLLMAVESYSLALFTRVLGWSNTETQVFLAGVRRDLKNPGVHTYCNLHVVYGRKPWYDYGYRAPTG